MKRYTILLVPFVLSSCSTLSEVTQHRHSFSTSWDADATTHYHSCTHEGCNVHANIEEHHFGDELGYDEEYNLYKYCVNCGERIYTGDVLPEFSLDKLPEIFDPVPDTMRKYLAMENPNVTTFKKLNKETGYKPLSIKWSSRRKNIEGYKVEWSTEENFANSKAVDLSASTTSYDIYNLLKNQKYYVRVTQKYDGGKQESFVKTTQTVNDGPRLIKVPGITNVRDVGGYTTQFGVTKQGLAYRGSCLSNQYGCSLEEAGQKVFEELGIKTEIEFRPESESNQGGESAVIQGAAFKRYVISGYSDAYKSEYIEAYKNIFQTFANKDNYPIYFHCTAGADRTGTVAFLLNALVGVDTIDLIHDYELTSFYEPGLRSYQNIVDECQTYTNLFIQLRDKISEFPGNLYCNKVEAFMKGTYGLTDNEIQSIKDIMLGNK